MIYFISFFLEKKKTLSKRFRDIEIEKKLSRSLKPLVLFGIILNLDLGKLHL